CLAPSSHWARPPVLARMAVVRGTAAVGLSRRGPAPPATASLRLELAVPTLQRQSPVPIARRQAGCRDRAVDCAAWPEGCPADPGGGRDALRTGVHRCRHCGGPSLPGARNDP